MSIKGIVVFCAGNTIEYSVIYDNAHTDIFTDKNVPAEIVEIINWKNPYKRIRTKENNLSIFIYETEE